MAKKRKTEYTRNRERIMSYIRSQKKKGIFIGINIPTEKQLRKQGIKGTELTKRTNQIKKLTLKTLKAEHTQATFDPDTGEIFEDYTAPQQSEPTSPTNEPDFTPPPSTLGSDNMWVSTIIGGWYTELERFTQGEYYSFLKSFMDKLIADNGESDVAHALIDAGNDGIFLTWEVSYKEEAYQSYCDAILDYLPEAGDFYKDALRDLVREHTEDFETAEDWEEPE